MSPRLRLKRALYATDLNTPVPWCAPALMLHAYFLSSSSSFFFLLSALSSGAAKPHNKNKIMAGRCVKTLLLSTALLNCVSGGPNCDSAIEANLCPDAFSLEELGTCLTAKKSELDENCALFVEVFLKNFYEIFQNIYFISIKFDSCLDFYCSYLITYY